MSDYCHMVFNDGDNGDFMSILIKDMQMPNSCLDCPCSLNLFFYRVCDCREIDTGVRHEDDSIVVTRPYWCPLVEIKDE